MGISLVESLFRLVPDLALVRSKQVHISCERSVNFSVKARPSERISCERSVNFSVKARASERKNGRGKNEKSANLTVHSYSVVLTACFGIDRLSAFESWDCDLEIKMLSSFSTSV